MFEFLRSNDPCHVVVKTTSGRILYNLVLDPGSDFELTIPDEAIKHLGPSTLTEN